MRTMTTEHLIVGVDTGGTFTDFVCLRRGRIESWKVRSTPDAPEQAIIEGLSRLAGAHRLVHGSTVATNAVLEGKGARAAFVTNKGFADTLTIGRQARAELYQLNPQPLQPPVAPSLCFEVDARTGADGSAVSELSDDSLQDLLDQIAAAKPEAVAVSLLFSFVSPSLENAVVEALQAHLGPDVFICASHQVLPEIGEYERGIATYLNAFVGPKMHRYLSRLQQGLAAWSISVMQSSGLTIGVDQAAKRSVDLLLSGPAGGLEGARKIALAAGIDRLITLDMGGTSTDVALIDQTIAMTSDGRIGRYPIAVPMVRMETIGAGGGSLAWLDSGGGLQLGPRSAGADPGPACYGLGGTQVTVTDANLALGRLPDGAGFGEQIRLQRDKSISALDALGQTCGMTALDLASGIVQIADEQMAQAVRRVSVSKGYDPRSFVLTCFGGAGGLHACGVADTLGLDRAMIPAHAGVLSALGMAVASAGRQRVHGVLKTVDQLSDDDVQALLSRMSLEAKSELQEQGIAADQLTLEAVINMRYLGQGFSIELPWIDLQRCTQAFEAEHESRYGYRLARPIEVASLRCAVTESGRAFDHTPSMNSATECPTNGVINRQSMPLDQVFDGPLIVIDPVGTCFVAEHWQVRRDRGGNLRLRKR